MTVFTGPDRTKIKQALDAGHLRDLFIRNLFWANPDQSDRTLTVDGNDYVFSQVAGYKGLRVWCCLHLPAAPIQRELDRLIGRDNAERLVIFTDGHEQQWRWPRRASTAGVNAALLNHRYTPGTADDELVDRLAVVALDIDDDTPLVDLLARMRKAFDRQSETAAAKASRLMGTLFDALKQAGVGEQEATLLLSRVLFLLFADDTAMWGSNRPDLFVRYVRNSTTSATLHQDLTNLFDRLTRPEPWKDLPETSPLRTFAYVNGGIFADPLRLPPLNAAFRDGLLAAAEFDWGKISPAVFGSMFQTVRDEAARRAGGEHYTTEENILKTLGPLFLDELHDRLDKADTRNPTADKAALTRLHNDLGRLRIIDPACGCGNFLVVAYRELRALELEILKRRRDLDTETGVHTDAVNRSQMTLMADQGLKVRLDHLGGIEIDAWPARIAQTALLLVHHLANQNLENEFGTTLPPLPIVEQGLIRTANALHTDWASLFPASADVIVVGNPPFIGQYQKTPQQTADTRAVWGPRYNGYLDYVTCWYAKALDYYGDVPGRWAFVSTNSICQGEAAEFLWRPILEAGWRCRFAHRSFRWATEAADGAAVHVSILGFDREPASKPILWTYNLGGLGHGRSKTTTNVNPYLCDARTVLVSSTTNPLSRSLPRVVYGSKPTDDGKLLVSAEDYREVAADPIAAQYLRKFVGARELLHGIDRWCLWLTQSSPAERRLSELLSERIAAVREMRHDSPDVATNRAADRPHLFQYNRQPEVSYLAIPRHVSESRHYFTAARLGPDVICGDSNFLAPDPDGLLLAILSSSMFIAWMRAVGGRIKSDLRFSNTFTYNTFPLAPLSSGVRSSLVEAAADLSGARAAHPGMSLAHMYAPGAIPEDVQGAHNMLDEVLDPLFGVNAQATLDDRERALFDSYAQMTGELLLI